VKNYLNVSEMGALFGLGVQTLHYYDRIDLFRPAFRDPRTGYRKYRFDQVYQLASIRYLRKMGYSLDDVRGFLNSRNADSTIDLLKERSKTLQAQWKELMRMDDAILRKIQFIEHKRASLDLDAVSVRWFPERRYIPIGTEEQLYLEDSFYFYPTIAFYEENLKYFGAYIDVSMDGLNLSPGAEGPVTAAIPAGHYLVGYHRGSYEQIERRFAQMRAAYPDLAYSGLTVNFNIIDQFVERNSERYITEIQMQLTQAQPQGGGHRE
jgi:DNA-binding transcriptional MerR regulator